MTSPFVENRSVLTRPARPHDATLRYGAESQQLADLWLPQAGANRRPLLVMIHGGFWRPAYDRAHTGAMCEALAAAGWATASIEYRRVPGAPDLMTADVRDAVTALARGGHGDGRLIVIGHSAGGHLCLYLAATLELRALTGAIALAPAADLRLVERLNLGSGAAREFLGCDADERADLDPVRLPSPTGSTVILHGREDAIVPLTVAESYVAHHPATRLVTIEHCGHFDLIDPQSAAWPMLRAELAALSR